MFEFLHQNHRPVTPNIEAKIQTCVSDKKNCKTKKIVSNQQL